MNKLLIIGGVSSDLLHLTDRDVSCAGGAGMYTAMAARRCGALVSIFSPRPDPIPGHLQAVASRLDKWFGPTVSADELPHFEIAYQEKRTEYMSSELGAQKELTTEMLPERLDVYDLVHIIPLDEAKQQLEFVKGCRQRGASVISAGTCLPFLEVDVQSVRQVFEAVDIFFMNDQEARALFGSVEAAVTAPGKLLFIILGVEGALIIQGETAIHVPAPVAAELDPTGARDSFCGATLACLLNKRHPIMAARYAAALAAEMIGEVGPTVLLREKPVTESIGDSRVVVNQDQVCKIAAQVAALEQLAPYPFVDPELPVPGHPRALEYFFVATAHQFSFWSTTNSHYGEPTYAQLGGAIYKGSDYLWLAYLNKIHQEPDFCTVERQAELTMDDIKELFRDDTGNIPMPALDLHLQQARSYGRDMLALKLTPQSILDKALATGEPLQTFLLLLDKIGGYKEDPLRKKSALLALILHSRPEKFLPLRDDEEIIPIIDYHLMRSCLRMGLVDVVDDTLHKKLSSREIVTPDDEWAVRSVSYRAMDLVQKQSGKITPVVNRFFFTSRRWCPEMSEPQCDRCPVDVVCAHRKELFQPVLRTTNY